MKALSNNVFITVPMPMVSIVIPAKNEEANIGRVLDALHAQNYPEDRFEIILVDNLSEDSTVKLARQDQRVKVLQSPGSIAEVRNRGIDEAKGDVLAFIDADCIAPPRWLSDSVMRINDDERIGIVSSVLKLEDEKNAPWVERYWIANHRHGFPADLVQVRTISSYCFCARKMALMESGTFDPGLITCEDADLGYRMTALRWKIVVDRSVEVIHLGNAKSLSKFFLRQLWQGRSNIRNALGRKLDTTEIGSLVAPALFCALLLLSIVLVVFYSLSHAVAILALAFSIPVFIAIKKSPITNIKDLVAYFALWSTYLLARGLGFFVKINRTSR